MKKVTKYVPVCLRESHFTPAIPVSCFVNATFFLQSVPVWKINSIYNHSTNKRNCSSITEEIEYKESSRFLLQNYPILQSNNIRKKAPYGKRKFNIAALNSSTIYPLPLSPLCWPQEGAVSPRFSSSAMECETLNLIPCDIAKIRMENLDMTLLKSKQ